KLVEHLMLAGEAFNETTFRFVALDFFGAFQRLKGAHRLAKAAFGQCLLDGSCQIRRADRFFENVAGGAGALQCRELALYVKRARNDDDGNVGSLFFQPRKKISAALTTGKDMVENDEVGQASLERFERSSGVDDARKAIAF